MNDGIEGLRKITTGSFVTGRMRGTDLALGDIDGDGGASACVLTDALQQRPPLSPTLVLCQCAAPVRGRVSDSHSSRSLIRS